MKKVCSICGSIHDKNIKCSNKIDPRIRSIKVNDKYRNDWSSFISSTPWRIKRRHILSRDNGICICCKIKYKRVTMADHVHHIEKINNDNKLIESNLISLCITCHKRIDQDSNYFNCKKYIDDLSDDRFILG